MLHESGVSTGVDLVKAIATARRAEQLVGHAGSGHILRAGRCEDLTTEKAKRQNN
jgi:hydroxymethylglutaryl-CoA lyase